MIYRLFRWFTGIALHWFYSTIEVIGREHVPDSGPVLLAASHHNALVDALIAGWVIPRRLTMTAKATLMDNFFLAWLFPIVGVVPLRRVSDERAAGQQVPSARRETLTHSRVFSMLSRWVE